MRFHCCRLVYIYDGGVGTTYFLQMIEPRFTLGKTISMKKKISFFCRFAKFLLYTRSFLKVFLKTNRQLILNLTTQGKIC